MTDVRRIVGVDYGERRAGIAVADSELRMAFAHGTVEAGTQREILEGVERMCREAGADLVVVGKPVNMDGSEGPSAAKASEFAKALHGRLNVRVELWDERLTTVSAERSLIEADLSRSRRKQVRDKMAAQIILQSFLDAGADLAANRQGCE